MGGVGSGPRRDPRRAKRHRRGSRGDVPRPDTRVTPADTRGEGFPGATGVTRNAKTPENPGFSACGMRYEDPALTAELRRQVVDVKGLPTILQGCLFFPYTRYAFETVVGASLPP
jgi:hypothetical protein